MVRGFTASAGNFVATVEPVERSVLMDVIDGVIDLLASRVDEPLRFDDPSDESDFVSDDLDPLAHLFLESEDRAAPTDPALRRLLPDASTDPELATELRRLTEHDLRNSKVARLTVLRGLVEQADPGLVVDADTADDVLSALNDIRLVLGARLGLESDEDAEQLHEELVAAPSGGAQPDEADDEFSATRRFLAGLYGVLTGLQDSLLELLAANLDSAGTDWVDRWPGA
jgi:hypothetical protein